MADIQRNLNRPIPIVLQLFFDVLDGLTPSWMVEQVGERKYMMEEDFRRTANYLKAVTSPGDGNRSFTLSREESLIFVFFVLKLLLIFRNLMLFL